MNYYSKKIGKWILRIFLFLVLIITGGLILLHFTAFRLGEWNYDNTSNAVDPERPNILLIVAEDLSPRIGSFGDSLAKTPNIDHLAEMGVRFPNVFTTAGVCAPSRAALISGMNQISMGGQHMRTSNRPDGPYLTIPPAEMKAFPELLRAAGYYTFNTAKEDYQFSGSMPGSGPFTIWNAENNKNLWRERTEGQPFFGMINLMETHETGLFTPLGHKPNSLLHFGIQVARPYMVLSDDGAEVNPQHVELPPYYPDTRSVRTDIARLYKNINSMDIVVGDILDRLEKDGLLRSTIVIFTTDHGDCLPRAKRDLFDTGLKVPMVIYWPEKFHPPGFNIGTEDQRMISFIDLAPTILDFAKVEKPDYLQGINFITDSTGNEYIYAAKDRIDEVMHRQRAVRDRRFKYIRNWYPNQPDGHHLTFRDNLKIMNDLWRLKEEDKLDANQLKWFNPTGPEQLYDLDADPWELKNLANDPSYAEELERMRDALYSWLQDVEDWSDLTENDMVNSFLSEGQQPTTEPPEISIDKRIATMTCNSVNASIGYKINDESWKLYTGPFQVNGAGEISARAIRYGWKESELITKKF